MTDVLRVLLLVLASAACVAVVYASIELSRSARRLRVFLDGADARLAPLAEKADVTVDAVNAELLRVDAIITRLEDVSDAVQDAVNAPLEAVAGVGSRVARLFARRRSAENRSSAEEGDASPVRDESVPVEGTQVGADPGGVAL